MEYETRYSQANALTNYLWTAITKLTLGGDLQVQHLLNHPLLFGEYHVVFLWNKTFSSVMHIQIIIYMCASMDYM